MSDAPRSIITDKLVVAKTGGTMEFWFGQLDTLGARKMEHAEIFNLVASIHGLSPLGQWNQNLLTTSYEWSRGIKGRGEKKDGFEISVSKTVNVPVSALFDAFVDDKLRRKWLDADIVVRKSTPDRSARVTWGDGKTGLSVDFYPKSDSKAQIVVQHLKIASEAESSLLKEFWRERLDTLKQLLEG